MTKPVTWERRHEAFKAIHDELTEESLSVFDPDMNFGEACRLAKYKGKLYVVISPVGQVWRFDGKDWEKCYDVGEENGRCKIDSGYMYSKWSFGSWDACHFSVDDKLYFVGVQNAGSTGLYEPRAAIVRYDAADDEWEYLTFEGEFSAGEIFAVAEFNGYLYASTSAGTVWRSLNGVDWTKVFNGIGAPYTYAHALRVSGGKIWVALATQEIGNLSPTGGKVYFSPDGTTWNESLTVPDAKSSPSALGPGSTIWGDYLLLGTNYGYIYLSATGVETPSWQLIGRVGSSVLDIRQQSTNHPLPVWLISCGSRNRSGALWSLNAGRLLEIFRSYGHGVFSADNFEGRVYYSWGWADQLATTHVRGHYAGVNWISCRVLDGLVRLPSEPYFDSDALVTTDIDQTLIAFNLGSWKNRILTLKTVSDNWFTYRMYGSFDGVNWVLIKEAWGSTPWSYPIEFDLSESLYCIIKVAVKSAIEGMASSAEAKVSCW